MRLGILEEISYVARCYWVNLKKICGISIKSDKAHLNERILRAIKKGAIHPDTAFTATTRGDGLGAQMLQRLTIQAAANDLGFEYLHFPFWKVGHTEGDRDEWTRTCEQEFELGVGVRSLEDCDLPVINFMDYAVNKEAWQTPHVIAFREMARYCNNKPDLLSKLKWPKYYRKKIGSDKGKKKHIAVHIRRGDVNKKDSSIRSVENTLRYVGSDKIMTAIDGVITFMEQGRQEYIVEIYSNGTPEELKEFVDRGFILQSDLGAIETFREFVRADVLIMTNSTFSYVAGLCSNGVVIYENQFYGKLSSWVTRQETGEVLKDELVACFRNADN